MRTLWLAEQSAKKKSNHNSHKIFWGLFLLWGLQFSAKATSKQDFWTISIYSKSESTLSVGICILLLCQKLGEKEKPELTKSPCVLCVTGITFAWLWTGSSQPQQDFGVSSQKSQCLLSSLFKHFQHFDHSFEILQRSFEGFCFPLVLKQTLDAFVTLFSRFSCSAIPALWDS